MQIQVGDRAPDITFELTQGRTASLQGLAQSAPVLLVFLRHFG